MNRVEQSRGNQEEYTRQVLDAYRKTPGTTGTIRRPDRLLAAQLQQRGVPLPAIENALVLAAYFLPVIEEVLRLRVNPDYFRHLRRKIDRLAQSR